MLFTRLAYGLGWKHRPATTPVFGSPAPQTSLIFELPDELILSILSHVSLDPRLTGHYARFRVQYGMGINNYHQQRVEFLRPLSMTCRAMRLRLLPWVWERLVFRHCCAQWEHSVQKLNATVDALHANASLGTNVRFMMMYLMWYKPIPLLVKCLRSFPNLHTLEIAWGYDHITTLLKNALKGVELPQIKTLILPAAAHPLLKRCRNVEDVVCVVSGETMTIPSNEFLETLVSNHDSKLKRLAIPLLSWDNASRYVAACPRLIELTILYPHPKFATTETGIPLDAVGSARTATSELVNVCKALPDFDTLQIVHIILGTPRSRFTASTKQRNQALREQVKDVKDCAIGCLRKPKTGCQEGEGRKKTTLRVIELRQDSQTLRLGSVVADEYMV